MRCNSAAHFLFEKRRFWTKIREFAAHFLFEKRRFWTKIRDVGRKYANLRLTSYLKSDDFGRKYAISQPYWICAPRCARGSVAGPLWVKDPPHYSLLIQILIKFRQHRFFFVDITQNCVGIASSSR